jgi:hypothetical protein
MSTFQLSASPDVLGVLNHAGTTDEGYHKTLSGDLGQMGEQKSYLIMMGFDVGMVDVYPALKDQENFDQAITLIYRARISGWWHYKDRLVELGVCTREEYDNALQASCERSRTQRA